MRTSGISFIVSNRGAFLSLGLVLSIIAFAVVSLKIEAESDVGIDPVASAPAIESPTAPPGCASNQWHGQAPLAPPSLSSPYNVEGAGMTSDGTFAYYGGGFSSATGVSNQFVRYDPVTSTWTPLPPMPTPVLGPAFAFVPSTKQIFSFGGEDNSFNPGDAVQIYNILSNTWITAPPMPVKRSALYANYDNGSIGRFAREFFLGSGFATAANTSAQADVFTFTPSTGVWTTGLPPMPIALAGAAFGVLPNGHAIVAGGVTSSNTVSNQVFDRDPVTGVWDVKAPMPFGLAFAGSVVVTQPDGSYPHLYVIGGGNASSPNNPGTATLVFDPFANTWSGGPDLNTGRFFPTATVVGNTIGGNTGTVVGNSIIVAGGFNGTTLSSAESLDINCSGVQAAGRVLTSDQRGLRNATITMTDPFGAIRTATTSSFGLFTFDGTAPGGPYVFRVQSRSFRYASQTVTIGDNLTLPDFVGLE